MYVENAVNVVLFVMNPNSDIICELHIKIKGWTIIILSVRNLALNHTNQF